MDDVGNVKDECVNEINWIHWWNVVSFITQVPQRGLLLSIWTHWYKWAYPSLAQGSQKPIKSFKWDKNKPHRVSNRHWGRRQWGRILLKHLCGKVLITFLTVNFPYPFSPGVPVGTMIDQIGQKLWFLSSTLSVTGHKSWKWIQHCS